MVHLSFLSGMTLASGILVILCPVTPHERQIHDPVRVTMVRGLC